MNTQALLDRRLAQADESLEYQFQWLVLDISEQLCELMSRRQVSRAELADRLGVSKAWVTKLLRGDRNITVRSLVKVAHELDLSVELRFAPTDLDHDRLDHRARCEFEEPP